MATDGWTEWPFDEVIDFQEGPGILAKDFKDEGVPLVRLAGLDRGASVLAGCNYLDPAAVKKRWAHFALAEGDILLSTSASLGRTAVVGPEAVGAVPYTGIIRMRPRDERLYAPFIRYLLEGPDFQSQAEMVGVGSVIRHFGPMHLRQMTVRLPTPPEQRAIVAILSGFDQKVELNQRMSAVAESLCMSLFVSWFIDFEPVRDNAAGASTPLGARFPSELVESESGPMPLGWSVSTVGKEFRLTMGQSPPGTTYNEDGDGVVFYQGRADFGFRFPGRRVFCTAPTRFAEAGDTLITVRAPVGDINMATETCCIGRGVAAARHASGASSYTYYFMRSLRETFRRFEAEGTVFGAINKKDFENLRRVMPPPALVSEFERLASPLDARLLNNHHQNMTLSRLRDALLVALMSGHVSVGAAERFVESV